MRVLVTGHRGFIGTHLLHELVDHGHKVLGHDRHEGDLRSDQGIHTFCDALDYWEPWWVVHLAAHVGRLKGEDDLWQTVMENAGLSTAVAKACGKRKIPVLYVSTSEAYGDLRGYLATEDGHTELPANLYGLSKRWGEEAMALYAPKRLRIARLSMPYGPGAPPGRGRRALDNFLWQAHHRMEIPVHRGAERSWCHVRDTVRGLRLILEKGDSHVYRIYNVGRDDRPASMLNLAERACELTGAPLSLIHLVDAPKAQTLVKRLSTRRLRTLGWSPTIELSEGLPELYEWVQRFDADGNLA